MNNFVGTNVLLTKASLPTIVNQGPCLAKVTMTVEPSVIN